MIIPEQFRVIDNQSVLPTFGLEIRVEMFHLEGDMITLHDSVCNVADDIFLSKNPEKREINARFSHDIPNH